MIHPKNAIEIKTKIMKNKSIYCVLALLSFLSIDCWAANKNEGLTNRASAFVQTDNLQDSATNKSLSDRLIPIKENFQRINATTNWTLIDVKGLWESLEGGTIKYYYQNENIEKIVTRHYGEMFQQLTEYYVLNEQLSFVYTKLYKYNRPMYYDENSMRKANDTEAFDFDKSKIFEHRSYFENGELIHQINTPDEDSPFKYHPEEVKDLKASFEKYIAGKDLEEILYGNIPTSQEIAPVINSVWKDFPIVENSIWKDFPITDSINFNYFNFEGTNKITKKDITKLNLHTIDKYAENYYMNYRVKFSDNFSSLVITIKSGDHELFTYLINFDKDNKMIDKLLIAYDEIAESASMMTSKINRDSILVERTSYWSEPPTKEIKSYIVDENGRFKQVNQTNK